MNTNVPISVRLDFARSAEARRKDEHNRQLDAIEDRKRERQKDAQHDSDELGELAMAVLATDAHISDFTVKLDRYDTATVDALMANQRDLERVQESLRRIREEAYLLPDGRRVFKTQDGLRVFDEHGMELGSSTIEPVQIDDRLPRWEELLAERAERDRLQSERNELHAYQEKLDASRERRSDDSLTERELKDLERTLSATMPKRVRQQLDGDARAPEAEQEAAPAQSTFRPGVQLSMPTL